MLADFVVLVIVVFMGTPWGFIARVRRQLNAEENNEN